MSRHAKNNTAAACFTYAERAKLQEYGTRKERVGADSIKRFDSCSLCLHSAVEPLACSEGHLFCKECIYECFLSQKQEIARAQAAYETQQKQLQGESKRLAEAAKQKEIDSFARIEGGIISQKTQVFRKVSAEESSSRSPAPAAAVGLLENGSSRDKSQLLLTGASSTKGDAVISDKASDLLPLKRKAEEEPDESRMKGLRSFWIPYLTPEATPEILKAPSKELKCIEGNHPIKMKNLITVNFTALRQLGKPDPSKAAKYMCPGCQKTLTDAPKLYILRDCGHVFCSGCVTKFIKEEKRCMSCSMSCSESDMIRMQGGGTGFAGHGDNLHATKWAPMLGFG